MPKPRNGERQVWSSYQVCKAAGISNAELSRRTLDGRVKGKISYGKYDAIVAMRSIIDDLTDQLAARVDVSDDDAIKTERLRWFRARADRAELDLQERRGELINANVIAQAMSTVVRNTTTRLLGIPAKLGAALAITTQPAKCADLVYREIEAALNELGNARVVPMKDAGEPSSDDEAA